MKNEFPLSLKLVLGMDTATPGSSKVLRDTTGYAGSLHCLVFSKDRVD